MEGIINALPGALAYGLIWGIMAIGVYITYKILDFADLSVDGTLCTGATVCGILIINGWNPLLAMLMAFLAGAVAGLLTGLFHTFMGIPAILSGILTQSILWSVNLIILGKANVTISSRENDVLLSIGNNGMAILIACIVAIIVIISLFLFFQTEIGHALRATGSNIEMSRTLGINTNKTKILALMISNGVVALSGSLLGQYQGFVDIKMGTGAIVIGLAAVIIGGAIVGKFKNNLFIQLLGIALGGIIYYLVYTIVVQLGFGTDLLKMLSAIVVCIFLAVPYWKSKYFSKKKGGVSKC